MKFVPASRGRSSFTARRAPGRDPHRSPEARRDALTLLPLIGFAVLSGFGLLGVACGAGGDTNNPIVGENPDDGVGPMIGVGGTNGGTPLLPDNCNGADCELAGGPDGVAPPGCGNGMLTDDEACDDSNTAAGDGCAANCLATEPGFSCAAPGAACVRIARCGDGLVAATEQCDDANLALGDGCSDRCRVELGKKCEGAPSVCTDAICGNSIQEGAEACDDGNTTPFDGCSGICLKEPDCSGDTCVSECGDGLLINEDCDDGNLVNGDGCSSTCVRETGFNCVAEAACELVGGGCALRAPAIFRDFPETHPDFGEDKACTALAVGAVANALDANRRPTLNAANAAAACLSTPQNFAQWYTSTPGTNVTQVGEIVLFDNGEGGYVNRFGALGEQFQGVQQGTDRGFSPTLAACGQICQNEANNQFQCDNQCRPISDQAQQLTNGQLIQLTNQLNQLENANPPDPVAIADVEAEIAEVQAEIADIQAQAAACLGTCETNRTNDAAACTATCKPCFTDPAAFCSEGVPLGFDGNPLFFPVDGITGPTYSGAEARVPDQYGYNGFPFERALFPGQASYNHNFYFTTEVQYWFKYDAATEATLTFLGDDDVWVFINGRLAVDLGGIHVPSRGSVTIDAAAGTVNATMQDLRGFPDPDLMAPAINRPGTVAQFGLQPGNVYLISVFNAERKRDGSSFQLTLSGFEATPSECTAICGDGVLSFGEECDDLINDGGYGECGVVDAAGNKSCRLGPFCGDGIQQAEFGEECDIGPVGDAECRGCRILDIPR
jgi:fibro-slime domain-containing protein